MSSFGAFGGGAPNFGTTGPGSYQQTGFGDFTGLISGNNQMQSPGSGYNYNPGTGMYQNTYHVNPGNPFSGITYQQAGQPNGVQTSGMQQFQGAAMQDYYNLVNANQMNYDNFMGAMGNYQQSITGGAEDIRQGGQQALDFMTGLGSDVSQMGQEVAGEVKAAADKGVEEFKDLSAQQASSISAGMMAQNRTQRSQLDAAAKTGDPNAIAALQQFELESDMKTAQIVTQQASEYNNALASLNMQRAGAYGQAGQLQLGFEQQAQALNQAGMAMNQSAIATAANFEAQGLSNYAQMVAANPFSPVSFLPILSSFFQFGMTTGSGSFPGIGEEFFA